MIAPQLDGFECRDLLVIWLHWAILAYPPQNAVRLLQMLKPFVGCVVEYRGVLTLFEDAGIREQIMGNVTPYCRK